MSHGKQETEGILYLMRLLRMSKNANTRGLARGRWGGWALLELTDALHLQRTTL